VEKPNALDDSCDPAGSLAAGIWVSHCGSLIHILLVLAVVVLIINLVSGRRAV
jgi:hypothetical protein